MAKRKEGAAEGGGDSRPRVLVVDDDPHIRALMVGFVSHLGYAADEASGGAEAIETMKAGRHGIVLLDCKMPGIDGFETTRRIRALDLQGGQPRIVGFSGEDRLDFRVECMAAGMDGYLPKPFAEKELRATLERAE